MSDYQRRPGDDVVEPLFGALATEQDAREPPIDRGLFAACVAVALAFWWFVS